MLKNAKVIMAKCCECKKPVAIRIEEREGEWHVTWAFAPPAKINEEGYEQEAVEGDFRIDDTYPGCPHCNADGIAQCGTCNHIITYSKASEKITCVYCNTTAARVVKVKNLSLDVEEF